MDEAREPKSGTASPPTPRGADRPTMIATAAAVAGMAFGLGVGEGLTDQPAWLRLGVTALAGGLAAAAFAAVLPRVWRG